MKYTDEMVKMLTQSKSFVEQRMPSMHVFQSALSAHPDPTPTQEMTLGQWLGPRRTEPCPSKVERARPLQLQYERGFMFVDEAITADETRVAMVQRHLMKSRMQEEDRLVLGFDPALKPAEPEPTSEDPTQTLVDAILDVARRIEELFKPDTVMGFLVHPASVAKLKAMIPTQQTGPRVIQGIPIFESQNILQGLMYPIRWKCWKRFRQLLGEGMDPERAYTVSMAFFPQEEPKWLDFPVEVYQRTRQQKQQRQKHAASAPRNIPTPGSIHKNKKQQLRSRR